MIKKAKAEKLARQKRKKDKPAVKEKRGPSKITELDRMAVRRALMAELIPSEWLAPHIEEVAEPEPEEPGAQAPLRKGKDKKAAKRKRKKQKPAAKEKPEKFVVAGREEVAPEEDLTADARPGAAPLPEAMQPAASKFGKPGRKEMDKKAKKEKTAKRKRGKQKSAAKEKAEKRRVTESEKLAVKEALAAQAIPDVGVTAEEAAESESLPEKSGRKGGEKQAKGERRGKQKRAKQKSAAKDKGGKRKVAESEKIAADEELAPEAVPVPAPAGQAPEGVKSKPGKRRRKAAGRKGKEERAAQRELAKRRIPPEKKAEKRKDAKTEKITVKKALLVEPVAAPGPTGPQSDLIRGETEEAPGAYGSARGRTAARPAEPIVPPSAERAADSPSRFWPGVALGTVAVIVGFGYIRHLAKEQAFPAPGSFVTAESERVATSAGPTVEDTVIARTRPPAPAAPPASGDAGRAAMGLVDRTEAVQPGETISGPPGSAPERPLRATPKQQTGSEVGSKTVAVEPEGTAAQPSRAVLAPTADIPKEQVAETRPPTTATPAVRHQVTQPRIPTEIARWQMPRPYSPYRPQFQPVRPGYPMYICPTEPRLIWYPRAKARDGK